MARLRRLHIPGGIHYVILHSSEGRSLFFDDDDYRHFSHLIERGIHHCNARVFAYCWTPHEVHLALQVGTVRAGRLLQPVAGQHARYINRKVGTRGHLFQARYWSVLLRQPTDLQPTVARIHLTPVRAGLVADPADYLWSSHCAYLGFAKVDWVKTGPLLRMLEALGAQGRATYRTLMEQELQKLRQRQQAHGNAFCARSDDAKFLGVLSPRRRRHHNAALLDQIIDGVATKLCVSRTAILSSSRRRRLSLARALVAWHATSNSVATLTEVARCLQRNPSTLCTGVGRYRVTRRDLFDQPMGELLEVSAEPAAQPVESIDDHRS